MGNVTVKIDDRIIKQARIAAVEDDKSLSAWLADLIIDKLDIKDLPDLPKQRRPKAEEIIQKQTMQPASTMQWQSMRHARNKKNK